MKWLGPKVNQSSTSSAELRNEWNYISAPPIRLQGVDRDKFDFFTVTSDKNNKLLLIQISKAETKKLRNKSFHSLGIKWGIRGSHEGNYEGGRPMKCDALYCGKSI